MAQQTINNGETGLAVRNKLNENFTEVYTGLTISIVSITGAVTLDATAFGKMHVCTGTTVDYTVGLPTAVGNEGKSIGFKASTALTKIVTVDANGTETIAGLLVRAMTARGGFVLLSDGANWIVINEQPSFVPYTPTITGYSSSPTVACRYALNGKMCTIRYTQSADATSNATTFTITLPTGVTGINSSAYVIQIKNNGTLAAGLVTVGASTMSLFATVLGGAFTNSGNKNASFTITFEIE